MFKAVEEERPGIGHTGIIVLGATSFLCDSEEDIANLPVKGIGFGSKALIIPTGEIYLFGPSRTWIKYGGVSTIY